eukprot:TRINITY_DN184_c0_g1_i2.p1 TRINITY_DN184_c0_g1~~TRINITY_DN184_c0_g1_i2.p1  ORF type:complete len:126 (-),score=31.23 TRINITY_DN184_c0_g1_i2:55-432(-)
MSPSRAAAAAALAAAVIATAPGFASAGIFSEQAVQQAPETANQVFEKTASADNQATKVAEGVKEMVPGSVGEDGARGGGLNMPQAPPPRRSRPRASRRLVAATRPAIHHHLPPLPTPHLLTWSIR